MLAAEEADMPRSRSLNTARAIKLAGIGGWDAQD